MQRRLAIWLPNWPVQRLVACRPELAGRAVVSYERHARYGSQVKACSALAWTQGVRPGLPLAEAQASLVRGEPAITGVGRALLPVTHEMTGRSARPTGKSLPAVRPGPHFELHDAARDRQTLTELAQWCEQFSPL